VPATEFSSATTWRFAANSWSAGSTP
jgi:hypothetical protein